MLLSLTATNSRPSSVDLALLMLPVLACSALLVRTAGGEGTRMRRLLDAVMIGLAAG